MSTVSAGLLGLLLGLLIAAVAWLVLRDRPDDHGQRTSTAPAPAGPTVPDGVGDVLSVLRSTAIVLDRDGQVHVASSTAHAYGLVRNDMLQQDHLLQLARMVLEDGTIREQEFEFFRGPLAAGRLLLAARVAPLGDGLALILIEDRTMGRRVEEVRRDFVVNVSHELKTPVGGLALLAEAVEDAADDPEAVARFAGRMKSETERLTRLVSEIVDLSRLQAKDLLSDMVIVDVAACAAEAVEHTRLVAGNRQVVATPAGPTARLRVYGDHELIATAIRNLVTNAIAYSEDGTKVNVVTRRHDDVVEVSVSDQGRGISPQNQERIFERFFRVDAARSRSTGGTGLGLSIVKHICANHGGEIAVWSEEGQGSTFTLKFPAVTDDDRDVGSPAPHRAGLPARVADPARGTEPDPHRFTEPPRAQSLLPRTAPVRTPVER